MKTTKFLLMTAMVVISFASFSYAQTAPKIVGGDRDKHGCIGSAGYTFSVLKKDCVRLFEQKIQLKEVDPKGSFTSNTAVILSENHKKAEIFLPSSKSSTILTATRLGKRATWKKGNLTLLKNEKGYILKKANKVIFSS